MDEALEAPHVLEAVHDEQGLALRVRHQVTAGADQRTQDRHHLRRADILYHDELADVLRPGTRVVRGNGWDRLRPYRVFRHDAHKVVVVEGGEAVRVEHVEQLSVTELGGRLALDRDVGADARIEHEGLADLVRQRPLPGARPARPRGLKRRRRTHSGRGARTWRRWRSTRGS